MASSKIATAYVQIAPSMTGVAPKVKSYFGGAGTSAGTLFGSNLVGMIKGALAAAGIGEMIKKSLTEGAALQQSLGGVETLFKDSAEKVIANANQAFRTVGMSANGYMEQVTSFSASLLQSLGGDTAAAADKANMAMVDMADNANKFGTDMERITDAYQGFAKQNYTMLDNLKLGYGGTKTEMQRLLADAQKLTGVKYDINNLSDVYEAIHVIQQELGVTGTTAKEASSTLTGSFNAMKAAAKNVLGNLALGQAMGPSLQALAQTTVTFLTGNLVPAIWNIVTALPGALVTFINALLPANMSSVVGTLVGQFSQFMTANLPVLLSNGVTMISQMQLGFYDGISGFLLTVGNLISQLLSALMMAAPSLSASGASLIMSLVKGFLTEGLPKMISTGATIIGQLLSTFAKHLPDMLVQGISLTDQLLVGLISKIPDVIKSAKEIAKTVLDTIKETDWIGLGKAIIEGIVKGIKNAAQSLFNALKDLASHALQAAKDALDINSPSRRFENEVGYQMPAGQAKGIRRGFPLVQNALKSLNDLTVSKFVSGLRVGGFGAAGTGEGGYGRSVVVNQYIYSEAKTAAELMSEARYQAEKAVLLGV